MQVQPFAFQRQRAGFGERNDEQIVHHPAQITRLLQDAPKYVAGVEIGVFRCAQGNFGFPPDDGQRGTQFVADIGKESAAAFIRHG